MTIEELIETFERFPKKDEKVYVALFNQIGSAEESLFPIKSVYLHSLKGVICLGIERNFNEPQLNWKIGEKNENK